MGQIFWGIDQQAWDRGLSASACRSGCAQRNAV